MDSPSTLQYGAMEAAEGPQLASSRVKARRRAHLGLAGVCAAGLCCFGMLLVFHAGRVPLRTELAYPMSESGLAAQSALYNGGEDDPGSLSEYVPGSVPYVYHGLVSRYKEYTDAIKSAQASEHRMREVVNHYRDLYEHAYKRGFTQGQNYQQKVTPPTTYYVVHQAANHLGVSAEAWAAREKLLNRLHYEIVKEESKLETQRQAEKSLLQKHKLMRSTVDTLLHSSASTAKEIQFLRDRYAEQIASLQAQLVQEQDKRQDQHDEWMKKSDKDWEDVSALKTKVAQAIATSDYYQDKAGEAKSEESLYRDRAHRTASDARVAKLSYSNSLEAAILAHEKEEEAIAAKDVAALKENAVGQAMRLKDASAEELAKAKAKLMEAATEAKVQTGIAEAAKDAAMRAKAEARDAKSKLHIAREDLIRWQNKILASKTGADTAAIKAKNYEEKTEDAKSELDEDMAAKEDAVEAAEEAVAQVEKAESQTALAKTQAKITETTAQQQKSQVELAVERVKRELKEQMDRVHRKTIKDDQLSDEHDNMLEAALRSKASVGDANGKLALAEEKAGLVEERAKLAQEEADEKKAKAEELLKTVDALAGLAREAAAAAAAERAKVLQARIEAGQQAWSSYYAAVQAQQQQAQQPQQQQALANDGGKQTIDIHVIPHSPVLGPPGEQGMAVLDPTDKGTVKLMDAGINP